MVMTRKHLGIVMVFLFSSLFTGGWVHCFAEDAETSVVRDPAPSVYLSAEPQVKPGYLRKAEREAAKLERKKKKAYKKAIKENLNRSMEIQTPEVRERMKLNRKEANKAAREKRKQNKARSRAAARKFR